MVQNNKGAPADNDAAAPKRRGRPRGYEPDVALGKALDLFRTRGFAATSLDDLSAATGMNRPSLYGAFGDKREIYIKTYQRHRDHIRAKLVDILSTDMPIKTRLTRIYAVALDIYLAGDEGPQGCFTVMTAGSEAIFDPDICALVQQAFSELDKVFVYCFGHAKKKGELSDHADPIVLAQLASATLHAIAIRARARTPRKELEAVVKGAIGVMAGT